MSRDNVTEREVKKAIRALDRAWDALEPLLGSGDAAGRADSVYSLRTDINEYSEYLERTTWWRKGTKK